VGAASAGLAQVVASTVPSREQRHDGDDDEELADPFGVVA
jgi:hypothetical protein